LTTAILNRLFIVFDAVFLGNLGTHAVRALMAKKVVHLLGSRGYIGTREDLRMFYYRRAKFVLAPRGLGR
jgi:hypothetical protein